MNEVDSFPDKIIRYLFYFLLAVVPLIFFTTLTQNPFYIQIILLQVTAALILAIYLLKFAFSREFKILNTPLDVPLVFLMIVCALSVVISIIRHQNTPLAVFLMGMDNIIFLILNWLAIFYLTVYTLNKTAYIKKALMFLLIVAGLASLYGILQYFKIEPIWPQAVDPFGGRCVSTFGNPNFLASFLVLLLPLSLTGMLAAQKRYLKLFLFIISTLMLTALMCTSTRSAWIGLVAALIVIWWFLFLKVKDKKTIFRHLVYLALIGAISLTVVSNAPGKKVIGERAISTVIIEKSGTSSSQRFLIWTAVKDMFLDSPLIGTGWGTLELFYPSYQGKYLKMAKYAPLKTHANRAHNEILQFAAEVGLIGLGMAVWLLVVFIRYTFRLLKKSAPDKEIQYIILGLFSGITGMLVDNLFNVSLHFASPAMVFWVNAGIIISLGNIIEPYPAVVISSETVKAKYLPLLKSLVTLLMLLILGWISWLNVNKFEAAVRYFNGLKYSKGEKVDLNRAAREMEESYKLYPFDVNTDYELGNIYFCQGRLDKAAELYERAKLINFGYAEIYYNLGNTYARQGENEKAVYNLEQALQIDPNYVDVYQALGEIYIKANNWDKAKDVYGKIVSLNPLLPAAHLYLGNIYFSLGRMPEAIAEYKKVIELNPANAGAYKNLGYAYLKMNKKEEARKYLKKGLELGQPDKITGDVLKTIE
ncbi:MAG: tetratricopeptide repeat protein [bacterium]